VHPALSLGFCQNDDGHCTKDLKSGLFQSTIKQMGSKVDVRWMQVNDCLRMQLMAECLEVAHIFSAWELMEP